jgi:SAM-dependent methyltransferase
LARGKKEAAAAAQAAFYQRTAASYDAWHVRANDEHYVAARYASYLINGLGIDSLLDVGAGTGRAIKFFLERHPDLKVVGIEPVQALIDEAIRGGVPMGIIAQGRGEALPFNDGAFDAVCEFGVLHHASSPDEVLAEMMRVARKAVFISDSNRFGQGSRPSRWAKLALQSLGLWGPANWLNTRGKNYFVSEDDGLAYAYSTYDSLPALTRWADRVLLVPTSVRDKGVGLLHPLLSSSHLLLAAIKEDA